MRRVYVSALAVAAITLVPAMGRAQEDASRKVAGGGITVQGWMGKADGTGSVADSKLTKEGDALHVPPARRSRTGIRPTRRPATTR